MHAESLLTNFLRESGQQIGFCVCTYELERCGARRKFFALYNDPSRALWVTICLHPAGLPNEGLC